MSTPRHDDTSSAICGGWTLAVRLVDCFFFGVDGKPLRQWFCHISEALRLLLVDMEIVISFTSSTFLLLLALLDPSSAVGRVTFASLVVPFSGWVADPSDGSAVDDGSAVIAVGGLRAAREFGPAKVQTRRLSLSPLKMDQERERERC